MDIEQLQNDIKEIMNPENKWKNELIGEIFKKKEEEIAKARINSLINTYIGELNKEEWNKKSGKEQYEIMENIINAVVLDITKYGLTNWDKVIKEIMKEVI